MSDALVNQAKEIRVQAAALLVRAETLLQEMRQMPELISAAPKEVDKNTQTHGRRIVLELR